MYIPKNTVWTVQTTYKDGTSELNAIYTRKEDADKFAEFMKEHDGTNDKWIDQVNVQDVWVHDHIDDEDELIGEIITVLDRYKDDIPADLRSMIVKELMKSIA